MIRNVSEWADTDVSNSSDSLQEHKAEGHSGPPRPWKLSSSPAFNSPGKHGHYEVSGMSKTIVGENLVEAVTGLYREVT